MAKMKVLKDGTMLSFELGRADADGREIPINESRILMAGDIIQSDDLTPATKKALKAGDLDHLLGKEDDEVPEDLRTKENEERNRSATDHSPLPTGDDEQSESRQTGGSGAEEKDGDEPVDYSDTKQFSAIDLANLVGEREIVVTGTGQDGGIVRADNEKALAEYDAKKAAEDAAKD